MQLSFRALLIFLWVESSTSFSPSHSNRYPNVAWSVRSMVKDAPSSVSSDVSIPYDAAARLAYDEWRTQFNKGPFDTKRYEIFKTNYETITVANVGAKKLAREGGSNSLTLMSLNEYGDLTEQEYTKALQSGSKKMSTGDVLIKAVENAELQSEASSALGEAADALAEEEKKLAEMLGLSSVEELEIALDSLDGIAPDGGELDPENISREARIRDSYLKWCKDYEKKPDESRYPTFSNNFLLMEQYATETNKEMNLNQYADCTKEEYEAARSAAGKPSMEETFEKATKAALEAKEKIDVQMEIRRKEAEEEAKLAAKARATRIEMQAERAKAEVEKRKQIEEERADRLKKQAAMMAQQQAEIEASVIATARAEEEKQARSKAERARIEVNAAEMARKQAKESAEKLKRMAEISAAGGMAPRKVEKKPSLFASFFSGPSETTEKRAPVPPPAPIKPSPVIKATSKPVEKPSLNFFSFPSPEPKKESKPAPKPATVIETKKEAPAPASSAFSFFSAPASSPKPKVVPKPAAIQPKVVPKPAVPQSMAAPSPSFSFFSAPAPAPKVQVKPPPPAPVKAVKEEKESPFSFFSMTSPKPKVAPAPAPLPKKADVKVPNKPGTISLFGLSANSQPKTSGSISIGKTVTKPKPSVQIPNRPGTISIGQKTTEKASPASPFSFFGMNSESSSRSVQIPKPAPKVTPSKSFSVFGTPKPVPKIIPSKSVSVFGKPSAVANTAPPKSFFGTPSTPIKKAPPKNVPVLSQWRQNSDGSITGKVSNSPNFKPGTQVTTSPVPKGAKAGSVVKTGSGSQYYLS